MREIGSEFWEVPVSQKTNSIFPKNTQWFLSGRSALKAIIQDLGACKTVAMPSWCCDSMIQPFLDAGIEVKFYPVYFDNALVEDISFNCDILFLIDYFGYTSPTVDTADYGGVIIRDVTHSIFSHSYTDAQYYFGSLRKWCGVWTGGYGWSSSGGAFDYTQQADDYGYVALREQAMNQKRIYIGAMQECLEDAHLDKDYLRIFEEAEACLDNAQILPACNRDVELAGKLDSEFMRNKRRLNAEILRQEVADWLIFRDMKDTDCPMFVPVLVPDGKRDELRRYLIDNSIYCPVHWPISPIHKLDNRERFIYENELSLVCDQRYTEDDMRRIVEKINEFWRKH